MARLPEVHAYPPALRAIHWLTVLVVLICYGLTYLVDAFDRGTAARAAVWSAHISFGLVLVLLVLARLAARAAGPIPPPSAALSRPVHLAASAAHLGLYALLVLVPALGVATAAFGGKALTVFGLFTLPVPVAVDKALGHQLEDLHGLAADALIILAVIHAAAALWHHFVRHDDVLRRMLPHR